jgi:hypothetical protein
MTTLQALLVLIGFVALSAAVCTNPAYLKRLLFRCLMAVLMIRVAFYVLLIAALPFHKADWSSTLLHLKVRYVVDLMYAGGFIGYQACALLFPVRLKVLKVLLSDQSAAFYAWPGNDWRSYAAIKENGRLCSSTFSL